MSTDLFFRDSDDPLFADAVVRCCLMRQRAYREYQLAYLSQFTSWLVEELRTLTMPRSLLSNPDVHLRHKHMRDWEKKRVRHLRSLTWRPTLADRIAELLNDLSGDDSESSSSVVGSDRVRCCPSFEGCVISINRSIDRSIDHSTSLVFLCSLVDFCFSSPLCVLTTLPTPHRSRKPRSTWANRRMTTTT